MKKLMISFAATAFAVAAQAATFNWSCTGGASIGRIFAADGSTQLYAASGALTVYLFDADVKGQADLLAGLRAGDSISTFTSVDNSTINANSKIDATSVEYGASTAYNFYLAIVDGDNVLLTKSVSAIGTDVGSTEVSFASGMAGDSKNAFAAGSSFSATGWYSTASVPEPTSGLLMLIGMAGLALRRRRV